MKFTVNWPTELITFFVSPLICLILFKTRHFLKRVVGYVFDWVIWVIGRRLIRSLAGSLSMKRYARNGLNDDSTRFLQVPGNKDSTLEVDTVFVPLELESGPNGQEAFSDSTISDAGKRLLIVGDPGSGKSSLIKRLFRDSCRQAEKSPRKNRLPIQIELKRLEPPEGLSDDNEAGEWLFGQLRAAVAAVEGYDMGLLYDSCSATTGLIVLLDGLDEVSGDKYRNVAAALRGLSRVLAARGDNNIAIVTMRVQFYQQVRDDVSAEYPRTLYIRRFTPNDIYTFLTRWPFPPHEAGSNISRIYADLTDRPTLREMCSNPLVLSMYVANDQIAHEGETPDTRTEFYRAVVNELLVMRRRRQQVTAGRSSSLREQRESILGELAFANLIDATQSANSLSWAKAISVGQRVWNCNAEEAERRFRELAYETGIISEERRGETFRFIHLTFCEFLAAIECASGRKSSWPTLLAEHQRFCISSDIGLSTRLIEIIPFAHALMQRRDERIQAMKQVAALDDRQVLGRCFLETQLYDCQEWQQYLTAESDYLANQSAARTDETWIRRLHLFNVVVRDARDWSVHVARKKPDSILNSVFNKIIVDNRKALIEVFSVYAAEDAAAAIRLADSVGVNMLEEYPLILLKNCQERPFLALAMERASEDATDGKVWVKLVSEAALRFTSVAEYLKDLPSPSNSRTIAELDRGKAPAVIQSTPPRSYYRWCLTASVCSGFKDENQFAALEILAKLPRRQLKEAVYLSNIGFYAPFALITLGTILASDLTSNGSLSNFVGNVWGLLLIIFIVYPLTFIGFTFKRYVDHSYSAIVNLHKIGSPYFLNLANLSKLAMQPFRKLLLRQELDAVESLISLRIDSGADVDEQEQLILSKRK